MRKNHGERLEGLLARSAEAMRDDDVEAALAAAQEAAGIAPRSTTAQCALADALIALGRDDDAARAYERAFAIDGDDLDAIWGMAELIVGGSDDPEALEDALALCRKGIRIARKEGDEVPVGELSFLEAKALVALGDPRSALRRLDEAREILGPDPEVALERGMVLFELCRFDEAAQELETVLRNHPDEAWAHHYLGLILERRGDEEAAEARFARARALSPEEFPEPVRLGEEEFDRAVEAALEELPAKVRDYLTNVAIAVEPFPPQAEIEGPDPLSPTILGVFRGGPAAERSVFDPWTQFPASIVLYQRNLERFARSREELIDEIGITLLHEVGHFLGFDEDDLRERDLD
ncbi:MAG TPA: metallopeptidase family protein [Vulgatibacter sp.]|nr:metallopeptidase family protein [Vulgatibacter sp.]